MEKNKLEIELNWFDRTVGFFSPSALLHRKKAKIRNKLLARKYEGADAGRRTQGWNTASLSADAEIAGSGSRLRDRARDLVRNNPYAARGIEIMTNNVVGRGIKTQIKIDTRAKVSSREKKVNNIWRAWATTTACDFDGTSDFAGIQRIVMRAVAESGEILVRIRRTNRRTTFGPDGKKIDLPPIQLQLLEADFLVSQNDSGLLKVGDKNNTIIQGIEIDQFGKRVAYHLYKSHPGNFNLNMGASIDTVRIPAEEIKHCYKQDRPGQLRGVTFLHAIILRLRDLDLYEDAQLKRQQCAAMYTAFVHDIEGIDDDDEKKEQDELGEKMEPGLIELLPPGKTIEFANPPGADNYKEYTSVVLHSIASGLGISFEALTGDLSEVNFSSARMGFLEMNRNIESWRSNIMINQFLNPVFDWFVDSLELIGEPAKNARAIHTPPRREMIDPVKETDAMKSAIRSGLKSQSEAVRELGHDPDTHFAEIAEDNKTMDDLGLVFDSDSRKRDNAGKFVSDSEPETDSSTGDE